MAFEIARVQEQVWPQAGGAITVLGAELLAGVLDGKHPNNFPSFQSMVTGVALVGSLVGIGMGKAVKFCTGALWGIGIGILTNLVRYIYSSITKTSGVRLSDVAALVSPRVVGSLAGSAGNKALASGGLQVNLGRQIAVSGAMPQPAVASVGNGLEF